jgi:hypothetical protein
MNQPTPAIIEISGSIYRANERSARTGMTMRNVYSLNKPTFFLNNSRYLAQYVNDYKKGRLGSRNSNNTSIYPKRFAIDSVLRLLDMKNADTVNWILEHATPSESISLRRSFEVEPVGSVKRLSTSLIKNDDDVSLAAICRIIKSTGIDADGYYTGAQLKDNGTVAFHPEVGLCPEAFTKLAFDGLEGRIVEKELLGKRRRPTPRPQPNVTNSAMRGPKLSMENLGSARRSLFGYASDNASDNNERMKPPNIKRLRTGRLQFNNLGGSKRKTRRRRN